MRFRMMVLAALVLGALEPAPALAQSPAAPAASQAARDRARALAEDGLKHYQGGRYREALAAFREAERSFSAPTIQLMIARAHDRLGELIEAREVYRRIVEERFAHYAPAAFFEAQAQAKEELTSLVKRIPTLSVVVKGAPRRDIQVTVDAQPVDFSRPISRNPGSYVVVATAPDHGAQTRLVDLKEGAVEQLTLTLAPVRSPGVDPIAPLSSEPADARRGEPSKPNGYVVGAGIVTGSVLLVLGVSFLVLGISKANERDEICSDACPNHAAQDQYLVLDTQRASFLNASVLSLAGAGLVGAATTGYVLWTSASGPKSGQAAQVRGHLSASGLMVSGAW